MDAATHVTTRVMGTFGPLLSQALETGNAGELLVDPRLDKNFNEAEMFHMIQAAAACIRIRHPGDPG
ncbi:hypothetical protein GUJ93_ZPchr0003g17682 [Zizania palustris]|uniref:Uncharacterized protein n=1 Tax=Zizania palustris TaxID=103762 RepID=A0A8J5VDM0_ZIZPA|nr:hypothetical protein GUJ93_ZPchr0003g17682 [Zizania palustris]